MTFVKGEKRSKEFEARRLEGYRRMIESRYSNRKMKRCSRCKEEKPLTVQYFQAGGEYRRFQSWCRDCQREWSKDYRPRYRFLRREAHKKLRLEILDHYSCGVRKCACCGEGTVEFLTIDHVLLKGGQHRREIGLPSGHHFYLWLKKNGFPDGYQVLCFNCNCARGHYGICPHEKSREVIA